MAPFNHKASVFYSFYYFYIYSFYYFYNGKACFTRTSYLFFLRRTLLVLLFFHFWVGSVSTPGTDLQRGCVCVCVSARASESARERESRCRELWDYFHLVLLRILLLLLQPYITITIAIAINITSVLTEWQRSSYCCYYNHT